MIDIPAATSGITGAVKEVIKIGAHQALDIVRISSAFNATWDHATASTRNCDIVCSRAPDAFE